jgi:hypothetical protein
MDALHIATGQYLVTRIDAIDPPLARLLEAFIATYTGAHPAEPELPPIEWIAPEGIDYPATCETQYLPNMPCVLVPVDEPVTVEPSPEPQSAPLPFKMRAATSQQCQRVYERCLRGEDLADALQAEQANRVSFLKHLANIGVDSAPYRARRRFKLQSSRAARAKTEDEKREKALAAGKLYAQGLHRNEACRRAGVGSGTYRKQLTAAEQEEFASLRRALIASRTQPSLPIAPGRS